MKSRFDNQKLFIDDAGDLVSHALGSLAGTSEQGVASIILLLSTIPEYRGMMTATGDRLVSLTAAAVSLVVIKLALREAPRGAKLLGGAKVSIRWFALLYAVQLIAGLSFIMHGGNYIDASLIAISAVGAICSERIASLLKMERKENAAGDFQAAKRAIQLAELEAKSAARITATQIKSGLVPSPTIAPNVEPDSLAIIDEKLAADGRKVALSARQRAAKERQNALYELLRAEFSGDATNELPKSALARRLDVTATTITRDLAALTAQGRINGRIS